METRSGVQAFHAKTRKDWRVWLTKNSHSEKSVWLIIYHKKSATPSVYYDEAVEEALCFGWIDCRANKRDAESSYLLFTIRKPKSNWSLVNKVRVEAMIKKGLMTPAGMAHVDVAIKTGAWDALTNAQNLIVPDDLQALFKKDATAKRNFLAFSASSKRLILEWISSAKRPETRQQRVQKTADLAARNVKANHPTLKI